MGIPTCSTELSRPRQIPCFQPQWVLFLTSMSWRTTQPLLHSRTTSGFDTISARLSLYSPLPSLHGPYQRKPRPPLWPCHSCLSKPILSQKPPTMDFQNCLFFWMSSSVHSLWGLQGLKPYSLAWSFHCCLACFHVYFICCQSGCWPGFSSLSTVIIIEGAPPAFLILRKGWS